jgi:hypothetical protein
VKFSYFLICKTVFSPTFLPALTLREDILSSCFVLTSNETLKLFISPDLRQLAVKESKVLIQELEAYSSIAAPLQQPLRLERLQSLTLNKAETKDLTLIADHLPSLIVLNINLIVQVVPDYSETLTTTPLLKGFCPSSQT